MYVMYTLHMIAFNIVFFVDCWVKFGLHLFACMTVANVFYQHSAMQTDDSNGTYINWLYDLYAPAVGSSLLSGGGR